MEAFNPPMLAYHVTLRGSIPPTTTGSSAAAAAVIEELDDPQV
jgi:hypothetical protein